MALQGVWITDVTFPSENANARVLIVEDHPLVRLGLAHSINLHPHLSFCGEADSAADAWVLVGEHNPDAIIVDLSLRGDSGLELIKRIRRSYREMRIVVSTMHNASVYEHRVLRAGGDAYVHKKQPIETLLDTVHSLLLEHDGRKKILAMSSEAMPADVLSCNLSDRELEVFQMIGKGLSTRQISEIMCRSVKTIESFRARIKKKLSISTSEELARDAACWAYEKGIA